MKNIGFTLAEVLITLVIIGIVSAISVPTLINNTNGKEYSAKFKKAISSMNQALSTHYALEGLTARDYQFSDEISENLFKKRMNVMEDFEFSDKYKIKDKFGNKLTPKYHNYFATTDGIIYIFNVWNVDNYDEEGKINGSCNILNTIPCTYNGSYNLIIDVNGEKGPNQITSNAKKPKDIYLAQIYNQKVVPYNAAAQGVMYDGDGVDNNEYFNMI